MVNLDNADGTEPPREFITISIEASTFKPRSAGLSGDGRDLGARLYPLEFLLASGESPAS